MVKTIANLTLPFALLDNGTYNVSIDGKTALIILTRENTQSRQTQMMGMSFIAPPGATMTMPNDFYGLVDITRIKIEFPFLIRPTKMRDKGDGTLEDLSHDNHVNVQKICLTFLNRLIEVIRWHTKRHWIHNLAGSDVYLNSFDLFDDNGRNVGGQIHGQPILTLFGLPNEDETQDAKKNQIQLSLESEEKVPVHDALYLDALHDFSQGRFNKAVMVINTALESATTEYLFQHLIKKGNSRDDAKKTIDKIISFGKKKNKKSGFHKILTEDFKSVTGRSLEDESELWTGFNDARLKRKTTLHPYVGKLSEDQARKAIIDILNVMNWVLDEERYPVSITDQVQKNRSFVIDSVIKENGNLIGFAMWALYGDANFRGMRFVHRYAELNSFRTPAFDLFLPITPFKKEKIEIISANRNEPIKLGKLSQEGQRAFGKLPEYQAAQNDCPNDEWLSKHGKKNN